MSAIARWSYTNKATVWPYISRDDWSGAIQYGAPIVIACGYMGKASGTMNARKDQEGVEYVVKNTFWTEDGRVNYLDMIAKGEHSNAAPILSAEVVRDVIDYEMTAFNDIPDYEITT